MLTIMTVDGFYSGFPFIMIISNYNMSGLRCMHTSSKFAYHDKRTWTVRFRHACRKRTVMVDIYNPLPATVSQQLALGHP